MLNLVAVMALSMQILAPYLVWRSRWNIPTHIAAGFCMSAYVIPGLLTNLWDGFPSETVNLFIVINVIGGLALCAGTLIGSFFARGKGDYIFQSTSRMIKDTSPMTRRVLIVTVPCVIGMCAAYSIMGFVPMFAEDPFTARQFKGEYRDAYYRAAYLFRFCFSVLQATMPLLLVIGWYRRSPFLIFLALASFTVLLVSLARGPTATGVIFFLGILAANSRGGLKWYIPLILLIFPFGSVFYYILGNILDVEVFRSIYVGDTLSQFIANGSPDILDQLNWLHGFSKGDYFSMGRTIFGGLVPNNYQWNPQVWTLTYDDIGANISELATGGLRLTTAEWGYANFGWIGVVLIPLISGIISGSLIEKIKSVLPNLNILQATSALVLYSTIGTFMVQWYILSIHSLPAVAVAVYYWRANARKTNGRPQTASSVAQNR
ncbi:hypothetical protein [Sphingomonas hengshuiensis]|uniref:hypothetical protein n=1 Tax=Sphingomonas hengshuiensis TaxID=1609977 RepID=UPI000ABA1148|nr:hypothetical protein [Sphingomonas hengshuiensis]